MIYNASTRLYGVIGNPVKHSASPRLFNNIFQTHHHNGVYLGFEHNSVKELLTAMKTLSIIGFSVTLPFKEEVVNYLDELDESARHMNCANTVCNRSGRLIGYNFDGKGALAGLEDFSSRHPEWNWRDTPIVFLGNGGAARGILLTLVTDPNFSKEITVVARNSIKTEKLFNDALSLNPDAVLVAETWKILETVSWKEKFDKVVVINTTSIGMFPHDEISPVSKNFWSPNMVAYDIVYCPLFTRFLREAEKAGAHTITGLNMFLGQARLQLLTWTGLTLPMSEMHDHFQNGVS